MKKLHLVTWPILLVLAFIWGSSFILMKRGLFDADGNAVFSADQVASLRLAIAFLFLTPLLLRRSHAELKKHWKGLLITGLFGNCIPAFLFAVAQTKIDSSLAGMMNGLTPLFTFVVAVLVFKSGFRNWNFVGVLIGLVGSTGLILAGTTDSSIDGPIWPMLLIVVATVCYAISTNTIKFKLHEVSPPFITTYAFLLIGPPALIYVFFSGAIEVMQNNEHAVASLGYISLLSILGTAVALILFNQLVKLTTSVFAASVTYLLPPVALFWGYLDNETITLVQLGSVVVILGGIYLVNRK